MAITKDEALKLALEVMNLARAAHGQMLLSDPPQEAWKALGVSADLTKAMTVASEALAEQPAQEPVFKFQMQLKPGWGSQYPTPCVIGDPDLRSLFGKVGDVVTFYTSPQPAQQQEPVAYMGTDIEGNPNKFRLNPFGGCVPLYEKPQSVKVWDAEGYDALCQELEGWKAKAQRKPLTDEEIVKITSDPCLYIRGGDYRIDIARAIEAAHGITGEQK